MREGQTVKVERLRQILELQGDRSDVVRATASDVLRFYEDDDRMRPEVVRRVVSEFLLELCERFEADGRPLSDGDYEMIEDEVLGDLGF